MTICAATNNGGKLRELRRILAAMGHEVKSLRELGITLDPEETGETFAENARLKALAFCAAAGLPTVADDSGLCVDALNGAPGVYSARYGGLDDDAARYRLLLQNMRGSMTRAAHFHTSVVCLFPDGTELTAEGECPGTIAYAPMGDGGFGYDPVFYVPPLRKTFAQMTPEEKNAISHRGNALRAFGAELKEYLEK